MLSFNLFSSVKKKINLFTYHILQGVVRPQMISVLPCKHAWYFWLFCFGYVLVHTVRITLSLSICKRTAKSSFSQTEVTSYQSQIHSNLETPLIHLCNTSQRESPSWQISAPSPAAPRQGKQASSNHLHVYGPTGSRMFCLNRLNRRQL